MDIIYKCEGCQFEFKIFLPVASMPHCPRCGANDDVIETTDAK